MATISSHNPFRANLLTPNATGTSINPPPSFHTVAGDDETTLNPMADMVPDLPPIAEVDYERDLPTVPDEERGLPTLPVTEPAREPSTSPIITVDPPAPQFREEEPPAYTARPDVNHGESTLEVGPRRPFQRPRATGSPSPGPGLFPSFTGPGTVNYDSNASYHLSPTPTGSSLSFPRRRRRGHGLIDRIVDALAPFEQLTTNAGIGNLSTPTQDPRSAPRHARSFSSLPNSVGSMTGSPPPALPPRQNPSLPNRSVSNPTRTRSPSTASNSTTGTTRTASATSDFARDFYATGEAGELLNLDSDPSRRVPEPQNTGSPPPSSWSTPPGARRRNSYDANQITASSSVQSSSRSSPNLNLNPTRSPGAVSDSTTTTTSDFARDFYAAGEADELLNLDPGHQPEDSSSSWPRPPTRRRSSYEVMQTATSSTAPPSSSQARAAINNDNQPTTTPTPGHPLLRDGKILIYPKGHTCSKCFNVGYKRADPHHPCKKCWNKYSKPYSPALLYAPDANAVTTLQRPLPKLTPPQGASSSSSSPQAPPPPPPPRSTRPPTLSQTGSRNKLRSHRYTSSVPSSPVSTQGFGSPPPGSSTIVTTGTSGFDAPPPGAIVYPAGDARLGGVRCWRCGGTGRVSYFILDNSQCDECGGVGRIFDGHGRGYGCGYGYGYGY